MVLQRAARDLDVVERNRVVGELLVSFVPFAGDDDDVARLGKFDRARDRLRAIGNLFVAIGTKTFLGIGNDRVGIFLPWIIGSDDAEVGVFVGHARHERPLLFVAVAAAAKNNDQFSWRKFARGFENIQQRVGRMRVIDEDLELALGGNCFQSTRDLRRSPET